MRAVGHGTLATYIDDVAQAARTRIGVPEEIAASAKGVTERKFGMLGGTVLGHAERRRVAAYFNAVLRRTVSRSTLPQARECRIRMMAAAVEADLRASGAESERIDMEMASWLAGYSGMSNVPATRRIPQRRVDEYMTDPSSRPNTHRRVLSSVPPSGPHASTTIQLALPFTVAASA